MSNDNFRGVYPHKDGGWTAHIGVNGKRVYLGYFSLFADAKNARLKAEIEHFGAALDRKDIEIFDDCAKIPLHGYKGKFHGWAIIDIDDVDLIKSISWTLDKRGYVVGRPPKFKNSITLHRWLMVGTKKVDLHVDHQDGDKLNNRRENLRLCTSRENSKNTKIPKNNTSGAKGVSKNSSGRWRSRIWLNNKEIYLGVFDTIEEASAAYDKAAFELHGEFASPNKREMA